MPTDSASRADTPSQPSTRGARKLTGVRSAPPRAVTPTTRPVRSSVIAPTTVVCSRSRAPAFTAVRASSSSKSCRGRTTP